jgi:oligopeptidase B
MKLLRLCMSLVLFAFLGCQSNQSSPSSVTALKPSVFKPDAYVAPHPEKKPKELISASGDHRVDEYYWLNERENPAVKDYLEAENKYADEVLAPVSGLREQLFNEMKARIKQDDNSVPFLKNGYYYYTRFETGKEYGLYCRKKGNLEAPEEIIIDVNILAQGHEFCQLGGMNVSPDNTTLAYTVDYSGRYLFKMYFKNLLTGTVLNESFDCAGAVEWMNDSKSVVFDTKDAVTLRNDKIWRYAIGSDPKKAELLHHEKDETLYANLGKTKSDKYILVNMGYTQNLETRYLDADDPKGQFTVLKPRVKDFFYTIEHWNDRFLIRTNWDAQNFRLMEAPVSDPAQQNWKDLLSHREDVFLDDFSVFKNHIVTLERKGGLKQLHVLRMSDKQDHYIDIGQPTYETFIDVNPEFDAGTLRYTFSSLKTPSTVVDYDMETRQKTVLKTMPVLGGFDANQYETEFIWVTARDGVKVPVSLVYKKGLKKDGSAPCFMVGYGSYGFSYDPAFNRDIVSLLDRGFVHAIAHIRGGMEMGYKWYENGKMLHKMNTFTDFVDCSKALCAQKYSSPERMFASGRSAGGLLMGAVANLAPEQFKGIITGVPFVDVLTTMSDPSIPLTTGEYSEWGNPAVKEQYDYMKLYSPYDNLAAKNYPNILVLTSFADSQVQYFEPAKYVARLRDLKTDKNMLLFKTNMTGSHGGSSGRFERLKERALEFSWMMGLMGIENAQLQQ